MGWTEQFGQEEEVLDNLEDEYKNKGHNVASCYILKQPHPKEKMTSLKFKGEVVVREQVRYSQVRCATFLLDIWVLHPSA